MMNVIVKPLISEKMTRLTEAAANPIQTRIQRKKGIAVAPAQNRYGFVVDKRANKIQIKNQESATTEYKNQFLTERPAKRKVAVYIDKNLFDKMKAVVGTAEDAGLTKGSFVSSVLEDHLSEYSDVITTIFKEHQEKVLSVFED